MRGKSELKAKEKQHEKRLTQQEGLTTGAEREADAVKVPKGVTEQRPEKSRSLRPTWS